MANDQPQPSGRCEWLPAGMVIAVGEDAMCRRCAGDGEFAALLEEHRRIRCRSRSRKAREEYARQVLASCRRILDNRQRAGAEQGAHYWARQVRYWEKEA